MPGPWEKYAAPAAPDAPQTAVAASDAAVAQQGPWAKYAGPVQQALDYRDGVARAAAQGVTFGFGDELEAFIRSNVHGRDYDATLGKIRSEIDRFRAENPGAALTAEIIGGIASAVVLPSAAALKGASVGSRVLQSAKFGGLYGGLYGAGTSEGGALERAKGAAIGAGIGGATGGAGALGVSAVQAGVRAVRNAYQSLAGVARGAVNADDEAARRVAGALNADRATGQIGLDDAGLAVAQKQGQPATILDQGGETTRALARSAANTSPEGRAVLETTIQDRFHSQNERITGIIRRIVGGSDAFTTREGLHQAARKANAPAYRKAYQDGAHGIWTPEIERLTGSPELVQAMKAAATNGKTQALLDGYGGFNPGVKVTDAGELVINRKAGVPSYPDLQFWDYTNRELANAASAARQSGRATDAARLQGLSNALKAELDRVVPAFKSAREGAAAFFDAQDALEAGQKFVTASMKIPDAARGLAKMNMAERKLFREGFASELIDKVNKAADSRDAVKMIFGSPDARQRIRLAMGKDGARELEAFLHVESIMDRARRAMGNSTTARQLAEMGLAGSIGAGGTAIMTGDHSMGTLSAGFIAGALARKGLGAAKGKIDSKVAQKVAELLVSDDPAKLARGIKIVAKSDELLSALKVFDMPIGIGTAQQGTRAYGSQRQPLEITVHPLPQGR